jgi:hypothetical protein
VVRKHRVGSSPTSGTQEVPAKLTKNQIRVKRPGENVGPLYTNYYTNALRKRLFHRFSSARLHVREHVRVSVERDGYGGVTQHLRDDLRVDILGEQQRRARVSKIVEADLWHLRLLQQRLKAVRSDVAAVQRLPRFRREYEAVLAPQTADPVYLSPN